MKETTKKQEMVIVNAALDGKTYLDADSHAEIRDATLRKHVKAYALCISRTFADQWKAVRLIGEMSDHIKKDFGSDEAFAAYMGSTQSTINKSRRLAKVADECEASGIAVTKAFELLSIGNDTEVKMAITDKLAERTQKEIRAAVKETKEEIRKKGTGSKARNEIISKVAEKAAMIGESKKAAKAERKAAKALAKENPIEAVNEASDSESVIVPMYIGKNLKEVELTLTAAQKDLLAGVIAGFVEKNKVQYKEW